MKYYITGANGFIGQHVCEFLKGHEIVTMKYNHWPSEFDKGSTVIHLAAYGNHSYQTDPQQIIQSNIITLRWLLEAFKISEAVKFYNISTSSVTLPVQTLYSASKLFGEQLVNSYKDKRMVNVRPYSVYGPGEAAHRFIPTVIRCLRTGEEMQLDCDAVHDWVYVDDFITAMFADIKDIGTGLQYSNLQVVRMLEQISGKELNYIPVKNIRPYDTDDWHGPVISSAAMRGLFNGLKQTYERTA